MKKIFILLLTALPLFQVTNFSSATGLPVVDAAAIADRLKQDAMTAIQWSKEANQWVKELQASKDELLAKTGIRDVQGLMQDAASIAKELETIYQEGSAFYNDYLNNPTGSLTPKAQALLDKYHVGSTCKNQGFSGELTKGCEATFLAGLAVMEYSDRLEERLKKENANLDKLIKEAKNAKDPKATADSANAIALSNSKFERIKFQYEMFRDKQAQLSQYEKEMVQSEFKRQQLEAKIPDYKKAYKSMQFNDANN